MQASKRPVLELTRTREPFPQSHFCLIQLLEFQVHKMPSEENNNEEEHDKEMEGYEDELQQCADAVGPPCCAQEQADSASSKKKAGRKKKHILRTRKIAQETPFPQNLTSRALSKLYCADIFHQAAHMAAFKSRFELQMEQQKNRLALEEHNKMLWSQVTDTFFKHCTPLFS